MFYVRVENNSVMEVINGDPAGLFHPDIVWYSIADLVVPQVGDAFADGKLYPRPLYADRFDAEAGKWIIRISEMKAGMKSAIDANTNRIRDRNGMFFKHRQFAMTETAQIKWAGMAAMIDKLSFPITILTLKDKPFQLADREELEQFLVAAMSYEFDPDSPLATGRELRMRVDAAETVEELEAIVDERE